MGILDEYPYDPRKRQMVMPPEGQPPLGRSFTGDDLMDPTGVARRAGAAQGMTNSDIPRGPATRARYDAAPKDARGYAFGDRDAMFNKEDIAPKPSMNFDLADIGGKAPSADPRNMNFDLVDMGVKDNSRLAQGNPMQPPPDLIANKPAAPAVVAPKPPMPAAFAERAPLPPTRPQGLLGGPSPASPPPRPPPAMANTSPMPPTRPPGIGNLTAQAATLPQSAPMPPVRPPELGGIDTAAIPPPAPIADTPIIGMGGDSSASIADAGSSIGGAAGSAATGGMGALDGILGGIGGLVKAFGGGGGGAPPPAKPPQLSPSNAGPTVDAEIAADRAQAPQILAGILADNTKSLLDPRRQRQA